MNRITDQSAASQARAASDAQALLEMFRRIPVETLEATAMDLLQATRRVRLSKEEPDFAVRLKVWQTIVEQRVGAAGSRKPIVIQQAADEKPEPGLLRSAVSRPERSVP